jgi:hypothetical protein
MLLICLFFKINFSDSRIFLTRKLLTCKNIYFRSFDCEKQMSNSAIKTFELSDI